MYKNLKYTTMNVILKIESKLNNEKVLAVPLYNIFWSILFQRYFQKNKFR